MQHDDIIGRVEASRKKQACLKFLNKESVVVCQLSFIVVVFCQKHSANISKKSILSRFYDQCILSKLRKNILQLLIMKSCEILKK